MQPALKKPGPIRNAAYSPPPLYQAMWIAVGCAGRNDIRRAEQGRIVAEAIT